MPQEAIRKHCFGYIVPLAPSMANEAYSSHPLCLYDISKGCLQKNCIAKPMNKVDLTSFTLQRRRGVDVNKWRPGSTSKEAGRLLMQSCVFLDYFSMLNQLYTWKPEILNNNTRSRVTSLEEWYPTH